MSVAQLLDEIRQLISSLETTQNQLLELFARKHVALVRARARELIQLAKVETALARQLTQHVSTRQRLLATAQADGRPASDLRELVRAIAGADASDLLKRIRKCQQLATRLRRESWVHWVVSQRSYSQHGELLDLIAHSGERSPTYDDGMGNQSHWQGQSGVLFDASA